MNDRETLVEYSDLRNRIAELEEQAEALLPDVLETIKRLNPTNKQVIVDGVGVFTVRQRRTFEYPEYVQNIGERYKEAKKEAEARGEAVAKITEFINIAK